MYAHFDRAAEVHHALVLGDMDTARQAAHWLATHEEITDIPPESEGEIAQMQAFAKAVAESQTLAEAAAAASQMGRVCGDCHEENRVAPRFLSGTAPPEGGGPQAEMARHVWASERMWEGLVGPLDYAWTSGAEALRGGWLDPQSVVSDPDDRVRVRELVRHVYEIGTQSEMASDSNRRAELYGEFLTTCIDCHELTGAVIR
jgi:cytochrome c553